MPPGELKSWEEGLGKTFKLLVTNQSECGSKTEKLPLVLLIDPGFVGA